jgi:phenylalanine-4-hydroxylase
MRKIVLSLQAERILNNYFESYQYLSVGNDMQKRAFNYSKIIRSLYRIEVFSENTYCVDGKNFLVIDDICLVEYSMFNNGNIILINDIFFDKY